VGLHSLRGKINRNKRQKMPESELAVGGDEDERVCGLLKDTHAFTHS